MNNHTRVVEVRWHTASVFELTVERNDVSFTPGDCVAFFGPDAQGSRPYSIASGTSEPCLRFLIRCMPGGEVSPYLGSRKPGDLVKWSPPFGWFRPGLAGEGAPSVFIATGTGIAPFLAYLKSPDSKPPLACLYGVRLREDAVAANELRERVPLQLTVSREDASDAMRGRVTDCLDTLPLREHIHYYLCGLDAMIDEITVWLEQRGIPITHIHRECFFNANP